MPNAVRFQATNGSAPFRSLGICPGAVSGSEPYPRQPVVYPRRTFDEIILEGRRFFIA
ncbi:hypothetical protein DET0158 [Dehalococcoides mccartyi 195]|uniref:Uncharacterized protein n=1 Tax=Dehalococcoides mccartyi (strain ATCC BAA-2266 / KCTC 15142 / 195) TaxID=243164 RepID=Q3ZA42_DEHM1|nr:hypothetical protein DET0158 [Dehalococcoides mccartyi 195]